MNNFGYSFVLAGPPGTGKSEMAASIADVVGAEHTVALCPKPREANSQGYTKRGITAEVFFDPKWRPSLEMYEATGYLRLIKRIWELYDDASVKAVILDPFTDCADLVSHELLKVDKAATPRDAADSQSYYGAFKAKLMEITKALTLLQFASTPKHVIATVHTQPVREETTTSRAERQATGATTKAHSDARARGVVYEGNVLPAFDGSYKYYFAGEFDAQLFTDIVYENDKKTFKRVPRYVAQVVPDQDRHAKIALVSGLDTSVVDNSFVELFNLISSNTGA